MEPQDRPVSLFLDTFAWVELIRRHDSATVRGLFDLVASGRLVLPLSLIQYDEFARKGRASTRQAQAEVLESFCGYAVLKARARLAPMEIARALSVRLGTTLEIPWIDAIGWGFFDATPDLVDPFRPENGNGRALWGPPEERRQLEFDFLRGVPEAGDGYRARRVVPETSGQNYSDRQTQLRRIFQDWGRSDRSIVEVVVFEEIQAIMLDVLVEAQRLDLTAQLEEFVVEDWESVARLMPTSAVALALHSRKHANPSRRQDDPNDLGDVHQLSVAVPYCDIVLTERSWTDDLRQEKLDVRFATQLVRNLDEALDAVEQARPKPAGHPEAERSPTITTQVLWTRPSE